MNGQRKKRRRSASSLFKRPVGRPRKPMPPKIPDDPENIVRILMRTPPPPDLQEEKAT